MSTTVPFFFDKTVKSVTWYWKLNNEDDISTLGLMEIIWCDEIYDSH